MVRLAVHEENQSMKLTHRKFTSGLSQTPLTCVDKLGLIETRPQITLVILKTIKIRSLTEQFD